MFYTRGPHSVKSKLWKDRANFISDYFFTHAQAEHGTTLSQLRTDYMQKKMGHDDIEIWRKIKHAAVKTLLPLTWRMAQQESQLLPYDRNAFHMFGYDISINDKQEPVVIEVNGHPMQDLEVNKANQTVIKSLIKFDRSLKMEMIHWEGSILGNFDKSDGAELRAMEEHVEDKAARLGWTVCDDAPGVVIARNTNGKPCLTSKTREDIVASELEMSRKGPYECAFPLENGKNVAYLLEGKVPRTDVLVEWWADSIANAVGPDIEFKKQATERQPAHFSPIVTKEFERDRWRI